MNAGTPQRKKILPTTTSFWARKSFSLSGKSLSILECLSMVDDDGGDDDDGDDDDDDDTGSADGCSNCVSSSSSDVLNGV